MKIQFKKVNLGALNYYLLFTRQKLWLLYKIVLNVSLNFNNNNNNKINLII